jgi:hypothetical protein
MSQSLRWPLSINVICFTGTFNFGCRKECEAAVTKLGALAGPLTEKATFSWLEFMRLNLGSTLHSVTRL